jgi:hypothetical protein
MNNDNEITAEFEVYYDVYEYEQGDGMYPYVGREREEDGCIKVGFVLKENRWLQTTGPYIYGLDGDNGIKFLEHLNNNFYNPLISRELQTTTKLCISSMKKNGMTDKVLSTPLNELSKHEFVYRVLDEMMSCAWEPKAEFIVSLIGCGNNKSSFPSIIMNKGHEQLYPKKRSSY